jgi:flavin reductase (DIM6/NTAB) family NADH-FMN oxidoreductase RutF
MPAEGRIVGPIPEGRDPDEYDRLRRRILWSMPSGLYVLGTRAGDRRNLMTLNWASQVAMEPKLIGVAVEAEAVSAQLLRQGSCFALSILDRLDRAVVRRFVKPVTGEDHGDSIAGFAVRTFSTGAPVLDQAASWLDCRLTRQVTLGSHDLFIGEVVDCGGEAGDSVEVLRMEDTRMNYGG